LIPLDLNQKFLTPIGLIKKNFSNIGGIGLLITKGDQE
jgi:hypothetical protein